MREKIKSIVKTCSRPVMIVFITATLTIYFLPRLYGFKGKSSSTEATSQVAPVTTRRAIVKRPPVRRMGRGSAIAAPRQSEDGPTWSAWVNNLGYTGTPRFQDLVSSLYYWVLVVGGMFGILYVIGHLADDIKKARSPGD